MDNILSFVLSQFNSMDFHPKNIAEIFILVAAMFFGYRKYIKGTHSEKFIKGIFILILIWVFAEILIKIDLQIIGVFLRTLVMIISFSLVVIFQPELRRFLGYLGQGGFFAKYFNKKNVDEEDFNVVHELLESVKYLRKTRTGALIVIEKDEDENIYPDVGTKLNADVSQELLLTIFHPNTPLHDGAVVVRDNKIISAGVLLPLTEDPKLSWKYGTRHRAAIGMSEVSDAACLVVSEETGEVSLSMGGVLKKYEDLSLLKQDLEKILGYAQDIVEEKTVFNFIKVRSHKLESKK
ncbi:diadenylate cyclase CdaA [bacterium]|nr:diadenylate cyclase CdaA [bacterium]